MRNYLVTEMYIELKKMVCGCNKFNEEHKKWQFYIGKNEI